MSSGKNRKSVSAQYIKISVQSIFGVVMRSPIDVKLDPEKVYEAISKGVENAMWQMITNATSAPCQDFYATIEKAAKEAFEKVAIDSLKQSSK